MNAQINIADAREFAAQFGEVVFADGTNERVDVLVLTERGEVIVSVVRDAQGNLAGDVA